MYVPVENACKFLESLQRPDLALLVRQCVVDIIEEQTDYGFTAGTRDEIVVTAPAPIDAALRVLPYHDRRRIAEAIANDLPGIEAPQDIQVRSVALASDDGPARLLAELIVHREMMISVATGGERIQQVDDYYRAREARIREAMPPGVQYHNPHGDLWHWYHHWDANFRSYKERRHYVRQIFGPVVEAVARRGPQSFTPREPTGWQRVDRALAKARSQLDVASTEEEFQTIGLLCREVIISLAQAVFDPAIHVSLDGTTPSQTDANRMLEAYIAHTLAGGSEKEVRAHARAALGLALHLQHRRTATKLLANLCVEATASTAAILHIIAKADEAPSR